jgi:hypothetical protein
MPSANLDLMSSIYTARARGDFISAEQADPEIESVIAGGPLPGGLKGTSALASAFGRVV